MPTGPKNVKLDSNPGAQQQSQQGNQKGLNVSQGIQDLKLVTFFIGGHEDLGQKNGGHPKKRRHAASMVSNTGHSSQVLPLSQPLHDMYSTSSFLSVELSFFFLSLSE